ncbi:hypothetical protein [Hyphomicrobium sp.]|jgi:hypothetical protein|uniref:hypothetical protein n=1 Tax=Hyphomicrobium sp. TaxID=82 RepID=UPI003565CAE2
MPLPASGHELTQPAIGIVYQRAIDAYTAEDAMRYHSELVDLLAIEAMIVKMSSRSDAETDQAILDIQACAQYHRDAVDRLTDIIESKQQFIWRP